MSSHLLLWSHLPKDQSKLTLNGQEQSLIRENVERLMKSSPTHLPKSSFKRISSGTQAPFTVKHDLDLLGQIADLAAPNAQIELNQLLDSTNLELEAKQLENTVKLAGLNPTEISFIEGQVQVRADTVVPGFTGSQPLKRPPVTFGPVNQGNFY